MPDPGRNGDRTDFKVVGRRDIPTRVAPHICSGLAKYSSDIIFPNMLFGKVLRSPYAHARIKSMDTSKAEALEGVKAVITWEDEWIRNLGPTIDGWGKIMAQYTKEYLLDNVSLREDHEIGVCVAAETEELCDEALKLISDTIEWEVLPHVIDPEEAALPDAPLARPDRNPDSNLQFEDIWEDGDVVAGFAQATHIVEFDIKFPQMCNYQPEPLTITSYWEQSDKDMVGDNLYLTGHDMRKAITKTARNSMKLTDDQVHPLNTYGHSCY